MIPEINRKQEQTVTLTIRTTRGCRCRQLTTKTFSTTKTSLSWTSLIMLSMQTRMLLALTKTLASKFLGKVLVLMRMGREAAVATSMSASCSEPTIITSFLHSDSSISTLE